MVEVEVDVAHDLRDVHQVHLELAHVGLRDVHRHLVHALLAAVREVVDRLEALELVRVVAGLLELLLALFRSLHLVFGLVELLALRLELAALGGLLGDLAGRVGRVLAVAGQRLEGLLVVVGQFLVALLEVLVVLGELLDLRHERVGVVVVPEFVVHLLAQAVVLDDFDEVELLEPPVGVGEVLLVLGRFERLAVHLRVLVDHEVVEVRLELHACAVDLALVGLQLLQELADLEGDSERLLADHHALHAVHLLGHDADVGGRSHLGHLSVFAPILWVT